MEQYRCENLFDLHHTLAAPILEGEYPWDALGDLGEWIAELGPTLPAEEYEERQPGVWVARDAKIAPGAFIAAPCIIGAGTEVRHGAFLRGSALIGKRCVIGNSTEVKNAILFDEVKVPHYNYVGDSVLGWRVHLGAGTVLSNTRCDREKVVVRTDPPVTTNRRKLGAVLGDGCEVGCNCVLNPGTVMGRGCIVYPLTSVRGVWGADSRVSGKR